MRGILVVLLMLAACDQPREDKARPRGSSSSTSPSGSSVAGLRARLANLEARRASHAVQLADLETVIERTRKELEELALPEAGPAPRGASGVTICDELISRMRCYAKLPAVPPGTAAAIEKSIEAMVEGLEYEETQAAITESCQMSLDSMSQALDAMGGC